MQGRARPKGIGEGVPYNYIDEARKVFEKKPVHSSYIQRSFVPFPWEPLEADPTAKKTIDEWAKKRENLERAATTVGRPLPADTSSIIGSYSVIKTKKTPLAGTIERGLGFITEKQKLKSGNDNTVAVLMPLKGDDVLRDFEIKPGEDACFDGREPVTFCGEDGRLAILFTLLF